MKHINYRRILFIILFVESLFLVGYELYYVLYLPKPDFKITIGLLEETDGTYPIESTIRLILWCETRESFIPKRTIHTTILVNGTQIGTIQRWPSTYAIRHSDWKNSGITGAIGAVEHIDIPKQFLVDGEHTMIIKSYQRRGRLFFISGTVREKHDEYKLIVSDGSITALLDCPCPVSVRSLENEDSEAETGLKSQEDGDNVEAKSE